MSREPENQNLERLGGEQIAVHAERIHVAEQRGRETLEKRVLAGLVGVDGRDGEVEQGEGVYDLEIEDESGSVLRADDPVSEMRKVADTVTGTTENISNDIWTARSE